MNAPRKSDPNRGLKIMVLSLGLLLVGGTIMLIVFGIKKINNPDANPLTGEIKTRAPREYRHCGTHEVPLKEGEHLDKVTYDSAVAKLLIDLPDGSSEIRLVNICSGETLGSLTIRQHIPEYP